MVLRKSPSRQLAARALTRVLRVAGENRYREFVDRLHRDVYKDGFVVEGIRYYPDPCSIGLTPQVEVTGSSAADMIRERGLSGLNVLDICCGVGTVGMTMLALLKDQTDQPIKSMSLSDINIYNINSLEKTIRLNPSSLWGDVKTEAILSDGLKHIEPANQFDLIVSNPPHFFTDDYIDFTLQPSVLAVMDAGWKFHREFYQSVDKYLSPSGEVWFLENHLAKPEEVLTDIIKENPNIELLETVDDRREPRAFWMISRRRS